MISLLKGADKFRQQTESLACHLASPRFWVATRAVRFRGRTMGYRNKEDCRAYHKKYYLANIEKWRLTAEQQAEKTLKNKEWHRTNPEKRKMYRLGHREKRMAHSREYHQKHRNKLLAAMRERLAANRGEYARKRREHYVKNCVALREKSNAFLRANPHIRSARESKRRALRLGASTGIDRRANEWFYLQARTSPVLNCFWCEKQIPLGKRHVDHVVPISRGGSDAIENLCFSCATCNLRKKDKMPDVFCKLMGFIRDWKRR